MNYDELLNKIEQLIKKERKPNSLEKILDLAEDLGPVGVVKIKKRRIIPKEDLEDEEDYLDEFDKLDDMDDMNDMDDLDELDMLDRTTRKIRKEKRLRNKKKLAKKNKKRSRFIDEEGDEENGFDF